MLTRDQDGIASSYMRRFANDFLKGDVAEENIVVNIRSHLVELEFQ